MKLNVALLTGGYTAESEVSLKSAAFVFEQLDHDVYEVYRIIIAAGGWHYVDGEGVRHAIDRSDFTLRLGGDRIVRFDVAFVMVHGSPGEDGRLQGYLDLVGVPYTSCDMLTSALTMNKAYTKAVLADIPELYAARSVQLFEWQQAGAVQLVQAEQLALPYFVKPNAGGSSIGMTKVKQVDELAAAVDTAFNTENTGKQVIVEEFVTGREFSVGVYRRSNEVLVLPASEIVTSREFFDFEAKYVAGLTEEITPADLTAEQRERMERVVKAIYGRLNCRGMVRVDFFLERDTDNFYFIEINTIPGQTAQSFIPQQVRAAGMTEREFYGGLIRESTH